MKRHLLPAVAAILAFPVWADTHGDDAGQDGTTGAIEIPENPDLEAAASIYQRNCRACHGSNAKGASSYPGLADKEPSYIAEKLVIYRAGERVGPNSVLMIQSAKGLSDEDIANLSVYVATAFD